VLQTGEEGHEAQDFSAEWTQGCADPPAQGGNWVSSG